MKGGQNFESIPVDLYLVVFFKLMRQLSKSLISMNRSRGGCDSKRWKTLSW